MLGATNVQGAQLGVWILVAYPTFESAHCLLCAHRLRTYDIGDLEIECNILSVAMVSKMRRTGLCGTYSELDVALSICSSKALLDANQPAIILTTPCLTGRSFVGSQKR